PVSRLDPKGVGLAAIGYAALALLTQLTLSFRSRLALELGEAVIHDLRRDLFEHLQRLPMKYFVDHKIGRIISRFTSDAEAVRAGVQDVLFISLVNLGQMIVAAVLMCMHDWVLFMVIVGMAPAIWGLNRFFRSRFSKTFRSMQESFSRITATLSESVSGIRETQGFAREDVNASLFHRLAKDHSTYSVTAARNMGVFLPLLEFNTQFFIAAVLFIGGWRVSNGSADVETLYQFILLAQVFFGPIQALGDQYSQAMSAMAGAERVFQLLDHAPSWTDPDDAVVLDAIEGRVEFDHVEFQYVPDKPVLHGISFTAEAGQTIALVGPTGSGKSTVINLIAKFYLSTSGVVRIDGHDLMHVQTRALRRQFGIVLQQNFLFSGTVLDNICIGRPSASEQDVRDAAQELDCLDILEALPDGLQTRVGEGGKGISLGQRQLICFTRAMLANPRILILDEATSAVDTVTESRIQKALKALLQGRTSFVVAHRLSTIRHADQVLVLANGNILERGTHESLLEQGGLYRQLYQHFVLATSA
ncbi:MAG: ABC transporter ATP-binding protein, partial [Verrucomicrobia bacterium]|nr:ABC transporter ATP-binding protein [Verrucomicrobiota bacterium]